jgi:hypothetical protein
MAKTWRSLPAKTRLRREDKQAIYVMYVHVVHLHGADTPLTEGIVAWRVISKQILRRP